MMNSSYRHRSKPYFAEVLVRNEERVIYHSYDDKNVPLQSFNCRTPEAFDNDYKVSK